MKIKNNTHPINDKRISIPQETLICPVCGKSFPPDDDTKYIASGGYTCSWKCFLTVVKRGESKRKENEKVEAENVEIKVEKKTRKNSKK